MPDMVRDIRVDMKRYAQIGEVVEGVAESGKTAGGFVAAVTPIVGTVGAFNRGDVPARSRGAVIRRLPNRRNTGDTAASST